MARQILECLALPTRAPPLAPTNEGERASAGGQGVFEATFAPTRSDPGFDFDQSPTEDLFQNDAS